MTNAAAPSITRRLTYTLTAFVVGFWLVAASLALFTMHYALDKSLDSSLQETAQRLLTLAVEHGVPRHDEAVAPALQRPASIIAAHDEYLTYQVRDRAGHVLLRSHDAPSEPFTETLAPGFTNTSALRVYTEAAADKDLFIQVTETHEHRHQALFEAGLAFLAPLLLLVPLSVWAIRRIVGSCMEPVISIQREISERGAGNLAPLASSGYASELVPISAAVDRLMGRLRLALEGERAFAANSAHELRTPLASALAQVQRLQTRLVEPSDQERASGIAHELRRLVDLTEKLLQLSRADSGIAMTLAQQETNLLPVLELIVADVSRSGKSAHHTIAIERDADQISSRMDVDAFGIVMRNLIENAVRHGIQAEPVIVAVDTPRRLRVINGSAIVPADALASLTRRFMRGVTRAQGAGLGLAIADTILRQSGGRLELKSPATGRSDGFEAIVELA